jgi:hypothetical protein
MESLVTEQFKPKNGDADSRQFVAEMLRWEDDGGGNVGSDYSWLIPRSEGKNTVVIWRVPDCDADRDAGRNT